jgi:hypothetical protein
MIVDYENRQNGYLRSEVLKNTQENNKHLENLYLTERTTIDKEKQALREEEMKLRHKVGALEEMLVNYRDSLSMNITRTRSNLPFCMHFVNILCD